MDVRVCMEKTVIVVGVVIEARCTKSEKEKDTLLSIEPNYVRKGLIKEGCDDCKTLLFFAHNSANNWSYQIYILRLSRN